MKEFIVFNIIIVLLYFIMNIKILNTENKSMFMLIIFSSTFKYVIMPIIAIILNQLFVLITQIDRKFLIFSTIYLILPIYKLVTTNYKAKKFERFRNKHYDVVYNYTMKLLKDSNKESNPQILILFNTSNLNYSTHTIVINNFNCNIDNEFNRYIEKELFKKFAMQFNVVFNNYHKERKYNVEK